AQGLGGAAVGDLGKASDRAPFAVVANLSERQCSTVEAAMGRKGLHALAEQLQPDFARHAMRARDGRERDGLVFNQGLALGLFLAGFRRCDHFLGTLGWRLGAGSNRSVLAGRRRFAALCGLVAALRGLFHGGSVGFFLGGLGGFLGLGSLGRALFGTLLGFLARLGLLRVVLRRALLDTGNVEEAGDPIGRLRTNAQPIARAVFVQLDAVLVILGEERIIGPDLLEVTAIARAARVRYDNAIVRALLTTAPRKPDCYCHFNAPFQIGFRKLSFS